MVFITCRFSDSMALRSIDWTITDREGKAMRRGKLRQLHPFGHSASYREACQLVVAELQAQPWTDPIGS
jgi:hypothetical protein